MSLYISDAFLLITKPIGWRLPAQAPNQILSTLWYFVWHLNNINSAQYQIIRFHMVFSAERRLSNYYDKKGTQ